MLVPVLNINPGIRNFQSFHVAFQNVIQDENNILSDDILMDEIDDEINGVALNTINQEVHVSKYADTAVLIAQNADLEDKLTTIQKEAKYICRKDTLNQDQLELLQLYEQFNHVISIADIQLLVAAGHFLKYLSKCVRPAYATCYY